jgi:peptide-methionine (R)-S-oxide reductase
LNDHDCFYVKEYTMNDFKWVLALFMFVMISQYSSCQRKDTIMNPENIDTTAYIKSNEEWKSLLTPEQYRIVREKGTETPYSGKYNNFYEDGYYMCVACGQMLFDSSSKFHSGCGWPSFSEVSSEENIKLLEDTTHGMIRIEVQCKRCGAHLGHVFNDGPAPNYLRYCINSESLKFVPAEKKSGK